MTRRHAHVWQDRAARIVAPAVNRDAPDYYRRLILEQIIVRHIGKAYDWAWENAR